jgi:hypothetical protein
VNPSPEGEGKRVGTERVALNNRKEKTMSRVAGYMGCMFVCLSVIALQSNGVQAESGIVILPAKIDYDDYIFRRGEYVYFYTGVDNKGPSAQKAQIIYEIVDYHGNAEKRISNERDINGNSRFEEWITIEVPPKYGVFKIRKSILDSCGSLLTQKDLITFSVLPDDTRHTGKASPFGGHPATDPNHLRLARKIGTNWVRCLDTNWATWWKRVEPEKGKFNWPDEMVDNIRSNGLEILGLIIYPPSWVSSAPVELPQESILHRLYPPRDLDAVANYVGLMVKRYRSKIDYWEIWNEPDWAWKGTPYEYVKFSKVVYEAAKKANPDCKIVGMGGTNSLPWIEETCKAGILDYTDIISIHGYEMGLTTSPGQFEKDFGKIEENLREWRSAIRKYAGGRRIPVWITEMMLMSTSFFDELNNDHPGELQNNHYLTAARVMVKWNVLSLASGYDKFFYYYFKQHPIKDYEEEPANGTLLEYTGALKPDGVAYAIMTHVLRNAVFVDEIKIAPALRCYAFKDGRKTILVLWSVTGSEDEEKAHRIRLKTKPQHITLMDLMGNGLDKTTEHDEVVISVGIEPIYLVTEGLSLEELRKMLKASYGVKN